MSCHFCRSTSDRYVLCPMHHRWCSNCLEDELNLYFEDIKVDTTFDWADGCPVCTHSCLCNRCKKQRGADTTVPILKRKNSYRRESVFTLLKEQQLKYRKTRFEEQLHQQSLLYPPLKSEIIENIEPQTQIGEVNGGVEGEQLKEEQPNNSTPAADQPFTSALPTSPVTTDKKCKLKKIRRIAFDEFKLADFEEIVVRQRKPVVLTNSTKGYSPSLWSPQYLLDHYEGIPIDVRYMGYDKNDLYGPFVVLKDSRKRVGWYINNAEFPDYSNDIDYEQNWGTAQSVKVVMYAKDFCFGDQVKEWADDLQFQLPDYLKLRGRYDMLGYPPEGCRAIVLMAYLGCEGTRTPLHIDKLNTVAFNSHVLGDGLKRWWIIHHKDAQMFQDILRRRGFELHNEDYWMDPNEIKSIPGLRVYEVDQRIGDTVLVPPGVPHEVLNLGEGTSFAVAANVINKNGIQLCWELDKWNRIKHVRSVYRLKTIVYYGILKEYDILNTNKNLINHENKDNKMEDESDENDNINIKEKLDLRHSYECLVQLLPILKEIISEEEIQNYDYNVNNKSNYYNEVILKDNDEIPHRRVCDLCLADIFNRRFHCFECGDDLEDGLDICVQCFNVPTFTHFHKLFLVQKLSIESLTSLYDCVQTLINSIDRFKL